MACHCPVVSTDVGGLSDFIRNGKEGYLVSSGNVDELARRLIEVLSFSELRWRKMSDAAYLATTQYSWDDATDLFEEALHVGIARWKRGELRQAEETAEDYRI
jgi:glycosyltransferase involved in cell wall biosynthesis